MKSLRTFLLIFTFLFLLLPMVSFANDTDIYMAGGQGVEANVLILFDSSSSMRDQIQVATYVYATTYDPRPDYELVVPLENRETVYYEAADETWVKFKDDISQVECSRARSALYSSGHWNGGTNSYCGKSSTKSLRTGNYMNFLQSIGGIEYKMKVDIAKDVIKEFIGSVDGVKLGLFLFNQNCPTCSRANGEEGGHLHSACVSISGDDDTDRQALIDAVDAIYIPGPGDPDYKVYYTPLAETMFEIGLYFKGGRDPKNGNYYGYFMPGETYTSPIEYSCQKNYVIIMTDGLPTNDVNDILNPASTEWKNNSSWAFKIGDQDGDKKEPPGWNQDSHYLDDVAKYLYNADLRYDLTDKQNIVTYTIGFTTDNSLLEETASDGGGKYYYSENYQQLADKFQRIIAEILAKTTSFVAPIVPVSRLERTSAGDKIYLALFKPIQNSNWYGNIKKYNVAQPLGVVSDCDNDGSIPVGEILDSACKTALNSNGQFFATAISCWSSSFDGNEVTIGGVGGVLKNQTRSLYTYFGPEDTLKSQNNLFVATNDKITYAVLGISENATVRTDLINYVYGYDAYDDNVNGITAEKRDWILNSFLHSKPIVVHYGPNKESVIFVGSNSGMLHAFKDSDGSELWGFIPPNLLSRLNALHSYTPEIFVDGSPRVYLEYDPITGNLSKGTLIFGERRGGNCFYALDITDYSNPKYLWHIDPNTMADFSEMGQSWSSPAIGKIGLSTGDKWVAFIGGGYDANQDNDPLPVDQMDTKGRGIYVVDIATGAKIWRYTNDEDPEKMIYSIPSDIAKVDTNGDGKIDRLYVGDTGGRMWRFDIGDPDVSKWTAKIIFKSNPDPPGANDRRKIFYPPDVTLEMSVNRNYYEMLFFGTGDREAPKEIAVSNRLYALKDDNPATPYQEATDLLDVTSGNPDLGDLNSTHGWYIILPTSGEKSLSAPVVFLSTVYFTTFTSSTEGEPDDPCYVGEGTARLYAVKSTTGDAVFNLDLTNDVDGEVKAASDRSEIIGTAIPSNVIITFIGGQAIAYSGVGGGIVKPKLSGKSPIVPTTWRIVF